MANHPLVTSLKDFKGNARGCVYTEPLWGVPYNLIAPYVSIYMLAFGLKDSQIGLITSLGLAFQVLSALLSGAITDKLGRKRTTFIFDFLAWSIPCLIWAAAQNFTYFLAAAVVNSMWRITMNSWTCLMVEDTDPDRLVDLYSWIYISGLLAGFFTPIAGLLIQSFSLVPTLRGLYLFAFAAMTAKFLILNRVATETAQGQVRMQETKGQPVLSMLGEYKSVFKQILRAPQTLYTIGIMLVMSISMMINNTFWPILVTERIGIPAQHLAIYPFARSVVMLGFLFLVMPGIGRMHFKRPLIAGFACFVVSQLVLIAVPEKNYLILLASTFLDACSLAIVNTLVDRMVVLTVDAQERARIMAIIYVIVIVCTSPFGWIAGALSEVNRVLPFGLNIVLFSIGGALAFFAANASEKRAETAEALIVS